MTAAGIVTGAPVFQNSLCRREQDLDKLEANRAKEDSNNTVCNFPVELTKI